MNNLKDTYTLSNGVNIPCVGFGTWQTPNGETAINSVLEAIKCGYRHIDTAACYGNEESVGKAIKLSGINREELFVTSKLWNTDQGYESTLKAFDKTIKDLGLDYLDLYLIHWPVVKGHKEDWEESICETWKAFEKLYSEGKIRAIGVSNFKPHHLKVIFKNCNIKPMVNQIELHPSHNQDETVKFCRNNNILVEAWGPLSTGRIFKVKEMQDIADKYNKSIAQITLRWHIQNEILPLPKSVTPSRIKENSMIFDFELLKEDMDLIQNLKGCEGSGVDPDNINF
ncbi:MAG: aldo/keto reductase [Clostridium sp.]|uniref:Glyoxal reductase n=1 Tax=Clostridium paraputrificum TaxID=29363 RepID=A0A6N2ZPN9_9CLOT|nr:aldo/keto reductase [Clostridium sp.]MBS5926015.1 aldo/keto reductase [Clostridium sp.]